MKPIAFATLFAALTVAASAADAAEDVAVKLWRLDCGTVQVNNLDLFSDTYLYAGQKRTLALG